MHQSRFDLCVVIPAFNEERVIDASLEALRSIIPLKHVYVVSDGSSDKTAVQARKHTENVLNLRKNVGKATALSRLIEKYDLKARYKYILFSDADSRLSRNFLKEIRSYTKQKPACIVGAVASDRGGLVSAYRTYEYWLANNIFKRAQGVMRTITVAPGCASLYRSEVLDKLDFGNHTLTEDFDLTLQIYREGLGEIVFAPRAKVFTQDPLNLKDYWRQVLRWYTGFWQNLALHRGWLLKHRVALELGILLIDSFMWYLVLSFALREPVQFGHIVGYSYLLIAGSGLIALSIERAWWAMPYVPLFAVFQALNGAAYLWSIVRAIIGTRRKLAWHKPTRYQPTV